MRTLGPPLKLWDVRDVEAHVRTLMESALREMNARLDPVRYDELLAYLRERCWLLSGLQADGRTRRFVFTAKLEVTLAEAIWTSLDGWVSAETLVFGPYAKEARARDVGEQMAEPRRANGDRIIVLVESGLPRGAYRPELGLAFSTYSRRVLTLRVVDWYRATFGDSRYENRPHEISLDELAGRWETDSAGRDESYLDRVGPGARLEFVDELHTYVYDHELSEEGAARAIAR